MAFTKLPYTDNVTVIPAQNLNDIQDELILLEEEKADKADIETLTDPQHNGNLVVTKGTPT